jgi:hypothetical protein
MASGRLRHLPLLWAVLLAALLLGPALGPGYLLSYDLVWVPHLAMRSDFLGLGSALPRAVPSDAVVAVLDNLVPAQLLEKAALLLPLVAAAMGMTRLVGESLTARLVAVTLTIWNPFTAERLAIGHWTVLVGYGVLPWLVLAGRRARAEGRLPPVAWLLMVLGSLSATAGLVSAATLLVSGWRRPVGDGEEGGTGNGRIHLVLAGCALSANAPWLVAGFLHAGSATGSGASVFALHAEGRLPAPLAALGLGGIWNADVVPEVRVTFLSWVALALLLALSAAGAREWLRRQGREAPRLAVMWALGFGIACVTWLLPGVTDWLAGHVPGGGLLRDGTRCLALCLPVYAGLPAVGADVLSSRAAQGDLAIQRLLAGTCVLLPVLLLYDAAWGVEGALRPVEFPPGWAAARSASTFEGGDVLVLPLSAYRAPVWNHGRTVLDPLGRYLPANYLAGDALVVSGRTIPGDDPRVRRARRALDLPTAAARTRGLLRLGVKYVAVERDAPDSATPPLAATSLRSDRTLQLERLQGKVTARTAGLPDKVAMAAAWLAFLVALVVGLFGLVRDLFGRLSGPGATTWQRIRAGRSGSV